MGDEPRLKVKDTNADRESVFAAPEIGVSVPTKVRLPLIMIWSAFAVVAIGAYRFGAEKVEAAGRVGRGENRILALEQQAADLQKSINETNLTLARIEGKIEEASKTSNKHIEQIDRRLYRVEMRQLGVKISPSSPRGVDNDNDGGGE